MLTSLQLEAALAELGVIPQQDIFPELYEAYRQPSRHYHNDIHIQECLELFEEYRYLAQYPSEVTIAIYFHDAIYSPRRYDNEEKSAAWARRYLSSEGVTEVSIQRIIGLILATKDHYAKTKDEKLIVDIDLSILGAETARYHAYDDAVRQEYLWISEQGYREGRSRVIGQFLERDRLYHLHPFRERFEAKARANMRTLLDRLELSAHHRH